MSKDMLTARSEAERSSPGGAVSAGGYGIRLKRGIRLRRLCIKLRHTQGAELCPLYIMQYLKKCTSMLTYLYRTGLNAEKKRSQYEYVSILVNRSGGYSAGTDLLCLADCQEVLIMG